MKQTESKTSIIVLSYNTLNYTRLCLESIRNYTQPGSYELVVIDNGSQDGSAEWLKEQSDIVLQCNQANRGFPCGCNQGMRLATGDALLLLNSDTIVTPHWLENMRRALDSEERIGAVSCMTNSCSNMQTIPAVYESLDEMISFAETYNVSDPGKWRPWLRLVGFCLLVKRSVYARLGGFDEQFSPGNYEDDDFTLRIRKAGYELLLCQDTFIHHFGSKSFQATVSDAALQQKQREYAEILQRNWQYLQEKWQFQTDYRVSHGVIEALPDNMPIGTSVCLLNCGYGQDMFYLASCQPGIILSGVTLQHEAQQMLKISFPVQYAEDMQQAAEKIHSLQDYIVLIDDVEDNTIPQKEIIVLLMEQLRPHGRLFYADGEKIYGITKV